MKEYLQHRNAIAGIFMMVLVFGFTAHGLPAEKEIYQLRIYSLAQPWQQEVMDRYLRDAFMPALYRAGIEKVGVFKLIEPRDSLLVVLIPFSSLEQFGTLGSVLARDEKYTRSASEFFSAQHDRPPYDRMESILLEAFDEMPSMAVPEHATPGKERVYELRSYEGPTEAYYHRKVEMFNQGGETDIFKRLGFQPVFFGSVISGARMPNLMYMTSFSNAVSQEALWNAFRTDPHWIAIKDLEKYSNTVSHIDRFLLYPAEYSGL
jgi:hypothetical protein